MTLTKDVTNNKNLLKFIKLEFSEKSSNFNKMSLVEQKIILHKSKNVAEFLHNSFINIVSNLNILTYEAKSVNIDHIENPIIRSTEQYKISPSIVAIKSKSANKYFKFNIVLKGETENENREY